MTKRRRPVRVLAAPIVAVCLVFGLTMPAYGTNQLRWGYTQKPTSKELDTKCVITTEIWVQELGLSGVTRLKAKFELRGPNDTLYIPGLWYAKQGYFYGPRFPNDVQSWSTGFRAVFYQFIGPEYKIRAIMVGERPSLWQRDLKIKTDLHPHVGCDGTGGVFS